ncbi:antibiotic biosynthesis monooxygenase [Neobacillus rhizosphaerae]|uniref:antibiotic biosynthesis monooxygenase family protein n=1 Tax=Neobacillus rhizosphaerae TaxID=2880965 RepID=UPI003D26DDF8
MNAYLTTGTLDFLKKIEAKYPNEIMVTMINENNALLFHESAGETVFNEPRKFEELLSIGEMTKEGFVVLNTVPVTDEGKAVFEHQVKNQMNEVKSQQGFLALRVLRPLTSSQYVIMTVWKDETSYQAWQSSQNFFDVSKITGLDSQAKIFTSAPYVSKYMITE